MKTETEIKSMLDNVDREISAIWDAIRLNEKPILQGRRLSALDKMEAKKALLEYILT